MILILGGGHIENIIVNLKGVEPIAKDRGIVSYDNIIIVTMTDLKIYFLN